MRSLSDAIRVLAAEYAAEGITPKEINDGLCADFASRIWEKFRFLRVVCDEDLGADEYRHTFLFFDGRFFDAETPDGVTDWRSLPIYSRH